MRLDLYLVEHHPFESRHKAQVEIKNNRIKVNGKVINKPSYNVQAGDQVTILEAYNPYVGKGGLKLAHALATFKFDVKGLHALDIGASTGGFTECLLEHGVESVKTIDVGSEQLHPRLREDSRVEVHENKNFLDVDACFIEGIDVVVMDVSFTSSIPLIQHLFQFYDQTTIVLVKPQFETLETPKSGVIKSRKMHQKVLEAYLQRLEVLGLVIDQITPSPILGGSGNIEFLCVIKKGFKSSDVLSAVEAAYKIF